MLYEIEMNIDFNKPLLILVLGLLIAQPAFAQDDNPAGVCANELDDISSNDDIDDDNDGLIELCYLEDVSAMREDLTGASLKRGDSTLTAGCPMDGCNGYELVRNLDFSDPDSYASGIANSNWNWTPVGSSTLRFSAIFEGNGYTISNLQINRSVGSSVIGDSGLFSRTASDSTIRNVGVKVQIINTGVNSYAGCLVGRNWGNILNSHADCRIVAPFINQVGGLVGRNQGTISNSYVIGTNTNKCITYAEGIAVAICGSIGVGGLVGLNVGTIDNSYAIGSVYGFQEAGGLVGFCDKCTVTNSYAIGDVKGNQEVGGLFGDTSGIARGQNRNLVISDSYWNNQKMVTAESQIFEDDRGRTTVEMQSPTAPSTTIYNGWSSDNWDFGNTMSYPALRYTAGAKDDACALVPDTALPRCGTLLPGQDGRDSGLSTLFFVVGGDEQNNDEVFGEQPFSSLLFNYDVGIPYTEEFQIRPYTVNSTATVSIVIAGDDDDYFEDKSAGDLSAPIPFPSEDVSTTVTVVVADANPTTYHFVVSKMIPDEDIVLSISLAPDSHMNEGDTITAMVSGGNSSYTYLFQGGSETIAEGLDTMASSSLSFNIPEDLSFEGSATTQRVVFTLSVYNGRNEAVASIELIVTKKDNGNPQLELSISTTTLSIKHLADDPDGAGKFSYQWQQWDVGDTQWDAISSSTWYMVPDNADSTIRYRVIVKHRDGQGFSNTWTTDPFPADIDGDDDGLIDIYYLEDLDVVRHQLDGSGYKISSVPTVVTAGKITSGCLATCAGYELLRDLDFAATQSYINVENKAAWTVADFGIDDGNDSGWLPIGDETNPFGSVLNGNNYVISNLQINRDRDTADDAHIALFGVLSESARIENVGLAGVQIQGKGDTGSLVAENRGAVINSYAEGGVVLGTQHRVGGLVAINGDADAMLGVIVNSYANVATSSTDVRLAGGLVGSNKGTIKNSYALGNTTGPCDVGGLVGENKSSASGRSQVVNSYAAGTVSRLGGCTDTDADRNRVSALVAYNEGLIKNSYARGQISSVTGSVVGGLVAATTNVSVAFPAKVEDSYWDTKTREQATSAGGIGKTTEQLQTPIDAMGIYQNWSSADWDFGDMESYPALRYNEFDDVDACDSDPNTALPDCGVLLSGQPGHDNGLSALFFVVEGSELNNDEVFGDQSFSSLLYNYDVEIPFQFRSTDTIKLRPHTVNKSATVSIRIAGSDSNTDYFEGKSGGNLSERIQLGDENTTLIVIVTDDNSMTPYNFRIRRVRLPSIRISITDPEGRDVREGEEMTLTAETTDDIELSEFWYKWKQGDLGIDTDLKNSPSLSTPRIPADFVGRDNTSQVIVFTLIVTDEIAVSSTTKVVNIMKINNGDPSFTPTVTSSTISIAVGNDPDDGRDGNGSATYTWQRRDIGDAEWMPSLNSQDTNVFISPGADRGDTRYRVKVTYTDAQGNPSFSDTLGPFRTDIDDDDDGLIDIYYLEGLYNVRHQMDGSGSKESSTADKSTLGCPPDGCKGYELRRDLNFATTKSYINVENKAAWTVADFEIDDGNDSGWLPIGDEANPFNSVLNGNNYVISNLQINRDMTGNAHIALFGVLSESARIENVGLAGVQIQGKGDTGSLVAENRGAVVNSYAEGGVVLGMQHRVGGLVAINGEDDTDAMLGVIVNSYANVVTSSTDVRLAGGLVGSNKGTIKNSYALGNTTGPCDVGGLVGENKSSASGRSQVVNSYAAGTVSRLGGCTDTDADRNRVSALVAYNEGLIRNSYARGQIMGGGSVGGLVAATTNVSGALPAEVEDSYWDTDMSEQATSVGGIGKTTVELQTPIDAMGIYQNWSSADWDFGNTTSYPALRYTTSTSVDACDSDSDTALPDCGVLLPGQPGRDSGLSALFFVVEGSELNNDEVFGDQSFSSLLYNYDVEIPFQFRSTDTIKLRPHTVNKSATVSIVIEGDDTERDYFERRSSGNLSEEVTLSSENTTLTVVVTDDNSMTPYNFRISRVRLPSIRISITDPDGRGGREGEEITLTAVITDDVELSEFWYKWKQEDLGIDTDLKNSPSLSTPRIPADFVGRDNTSQVIVFTLIVTDEIAVSSTTKVVNIMKINNGDPSFTPTVTSSTISIAVGNDPDDGRDGNGSATYTWQRRDIGDAEWMPSLNSQDTNVFISPGADRGDTRYRVKVTYIDAQGNLPFSDTLGPFRTDIDDDDDGLIDIYYLEGLYNVRHQMDGSGSKESSTADKSTLGCPPDGCKGYELRRDLNFATTKSYINVENKAAWTVADFEIDDGNDSGWLPIGDEANPFNSVLNGNNYVISNLQINRDMTGNAHIALFGVLSESARIENVGLAGVQIQGKGDTGSLVAENRGAVVNSYAEGGVVLGMQHRVGGLVAINGEDDTDAMLGVIVNSYANVVTSSTDVRLAGGLVGSNKGTIKNSYALGNTTGPCDVGGLVGENKSSASGRSQVVNSYAAGTVSRLGGCTDTDADRNRVSALVAYNEGLIRNSVSTK